MFGIFVIAIIILVISFIIGLVVSGKDYAGSDSRKYTDDASCLFDEEYKDKKLNDIVPGTANYVKNESIKNDEDLSFDDELI